MKVVKKVVGRLRSVKLVLVEVEGVELELKMVDRLEVVGDICDSRELVE